jgi:hypothetical protein
MPYPWDNGIVSKQMNGPVSIFSNLCTGAEPIDYMSSNGVSLAVSMENGSWAEQPGNNESILDRDKRFFHYSDKLLVPPNLPSSGYQGLFP